MVSECKSCGIHLGEEVNDMCIECFADGWGELVERSPMVSPQTIYKIDSRKES